MTSTPPPGCDPSSTGSWGWADPDDPQPEPSLDPLSRRLLQGAAALSALLIVLVAYSWIHGGGEGSLNPIAQAAERTEQAPGARFKIAAVYSSGALPRSTEATGQGAYNTQTGRSRATLTVPSPTLGSVTVESVGEDQTFYVRSSQIAAELPSGKRWMEVAPLVGQGEELGVGGSSDSRSELEVLRAVSGGVETVGHQEIRGVSTTRYRASIDLQDEVAFFNREGQSELAQEYEQLARITPSETRVEAWVDAHGLLRRARLDTVLLTSTNQPSGSMDMRIDFFDFGVRPAISFPSSDEVLDVTPLLQERLHLSGGS